MIPRQVGSVKWAGVIFVPFLQWQPERAHLCDEAAAEISAAVAEAAGEIVFDEYDVLILALELFGTRNLDFVDCVLAARSVLKQDDVFTFDRKLAAVIASLPRRESAS